MEQMRNGFDKVFPCLKLISIVWKFIILLYPGNFHFLSQLKFINLGAAISGLAFVLLEAYLLVLCKNDFSIEMLAEVARMFTMNFLLMKSQSEKETKCLAALYLLITLRYWRCEKIPWGSLKPKNTVSEEV
jgi:hypothetical protein